jgi:outer membrane protein assembly factor BamA
VSSLLLSVSSVILFSSIRNGKKRNHREHREKNTENTEEEHRGHRERTKRCCISHLKSLKLGHLKEEHRIGPQVPSENPMPREISYRFCVLALSLVLAVVAQPIRTFAQDSGDESLNQERAIESLAQEEEGPTSVAISEDMTVIGIADRVDITGDLVTSRAVVLRQLTFRIGDPVSRHDFDTSRNRLLSLNGIYWMADFTWENAEEEGHIIVGLNLGSRRTWYLSPSIPAGGAIGDRNFLGTGDAVAVGVFIDSENEDHFYTLSYTDPQFLGGHKSMYVEAHVLNTSNSIRTDTILSTGESYDLDRTGFNLAYRTRWHELTSVGVGYRWDQVRAKKRSDSFASLGDENTFYYSGATIPDGNVGVLTFDLSSGSLNSRFFPTSGYYWDFYNELANTATGSDFNFTRHTVTAAAFQDIYGGTNVLCGRMIYSYVTGDPPDYELLPFEWQVRGYEGGTHRGKSLMALNFEYRFIAEPDIFQGVLFADLGRSWDDREFSFTDLEFGYGVGIRIYTAPFIPYNLLLRIDYGFSDTGQEVTFGFNQFF